MKHRILVSSVVSKWITVEVPQGEELDDSILYDQDDLFNGIDLDEWDATDLEIVDKETA